MSEALMDDDFKKDFQEALEKNLPKALGKTLQKRLEKLEDLESEIIKVKDENEILLEKNKILKENEIDVFNQKDLNKETLIIIEKREQDLNSREIEIRIKEARLDEKLKSCSNMVENMRFSLETVFQNRTVREISHQNIVRRHDLPGTYINNDSQGNPVYSEPLRSDEIVPVENSKKTIES